LELCPPLVSGPEPVVKLLRALAFPPYTIFYH
jgi:hypothetical protein